MLEQFKYISSMDSGSDSSSSRDRSTSGGCGHSRIACLTEEKLEQIASLYRDYCSELYINKYPVGICIEGNQSFVDRGDAILLMTWLPEKCRALLYIVHPESGMPFTKTELGVYSHYNVVGELYHLINAGLQTIGLSFSCVESSTSFKEAMRAMIERASRATSHKPRHWFTRGWGQKKKLLREAEEIAVEDDEEDLPFSLASFTILDPATKVFTPHGPPSLTSPPASSDPSSRSATRDQGNCVSSAVATSPHTNGQRPKNRRHWRFSSLWE